MINLPLRDDLAQQHWEAIKWHLSGLKKSSRTNNLDHFEKRVKLVFPDKTLEDVIVAQPQKLEEMKKEFSECLGSSLDQKKLKKDFQCFLTNYDKLNKRVMELEDKTFYTSHTIIQNLGLQVCPYCNRNQIGYIKGRNKAIHTLDHFYPKAHYPILALSFYNLIPCCAACNKLKGPKEPTFPNPYGCKHDWKFKVRPSNANFLTNDEGVSLDLVSTDSDEKLRAFEEVFHVSDAYEIHKREAREVLIRHHVYNDTFLKELAKTLNVNGSDSMSALKEMVFGQQPTGEDIVHRALGKLAYDILKDADLLL